jgi:PPOX class probable F420-dependent enzyme
MVLGLVAEARRAVLATLDPAGRPRLVPICLVAEPDSPGGSEADSGLVLYSPLDEKPKRASDPMRLARVRDLLARPEAAVLVDRWAEDWDGLAWVRLACRGRLLAPNGPDAKEHARSVAALRAKYPQYRTQALEARPLIRLDCTVAATWGALGEGAT